MKIDDTTAPEGENTATETATQPVKTERKPRKAKAAKAPKAKKVKGAKKAKAARKSGSKSNGGKPMSALKAARSQYVVDKKNKTAGGNVSVHCGDKVAKELTGLDLDKVFDKAAKIKGVSAETLKRKYSHLNVGAKRMTLGNIIRAAA